MQYGVITLIDKAQTVNSKITIKDILYPFAILLLMLSIFDLSANLAYSGILIGLIQGIIVISTEDDTTIFNLMLNFIAQISAASIFLFLYKSQKIEVEEKKAIPVPYIPLILIIFSMQYFFLFIINIVLNILLAPFGPVISAYEDISPSQSLLVNPLYYILFFGVLCFGAALSEELIFRRSLIPMLERRGMGSFWALMISSLFFSMIHMPADIIQGTLTWTIIHFVGTFIGGLTMGYVYVRTRQVRWSVLLHASNNGIAGISLIALGLYDYYQEYYLLGIIGILILIALGLGFIGFVYYFIQFTQHHLDQSPPVWITVITDKRIKFNNFKNFIGISIIFLLLEAILPVALDEVFKVIEETITVTREYLLLKTLFISFYHLIIVLLVLYLIFKQLNPLKEANWIEEEHKFVGLEQPLSNKVERIQKFCIVCGAKILPNFSYCSYCGTKLIQLNNKDIENKEKLHENEP